MSAFLNIVRAVESRFAANFTAVPAANIAFDNVPFDVPTTSWVRLVVNPGVSEQVAMGATKQFRHSGLITVQVFTPVDKGSQAAFDLADDVSEIWRGASFSGIIARVPSATVAGVRDGWFQINVDVPFYFDEYAAN